MKILTIDSNTSRLNQISELLTTKGYDIYPAENGTSGIQLYSSILPHMILIDTALTDQHFKDVISHVRNECYDNIPILAICSTPMNLDKDCGHCASIVLPDDINQLENMVSMMLGASGTKMDADQPIGKSATTVSKFLQLFSF